MQGQIPVPALLVAKRWRCGKAGTGTCPYD